MIITTTQSIDSKKITNYLGIVAGADTYLMAGVMGGGVTGKGQSTYYNAALNSAISTMSIAANNLKADAVLGVIINVSSSGNGTVAVTASGTAVKLEDIGFDDELPDL